MKKTVLLIAILVIPALAYLILQTGENNFKRLDIFGPREPVSGSTEDTVYHTVGGFSFISQDSSLVTAETVKDKIYIADFFFTTCQTICPKMTNQMMRVQHEFRSDPDILLLSFTVDPENDTPPVLAKYAAEHNAISGKWFFITGDKQQLYDVARNSFFITAMEGNGGPDDFIHSEKIVLVDKQGRIRGIYDGTDYYEVSRLIDEIKVLKLEYAGQSK